MDTSGGWAADEPRWPVGLQGFFLLFFNYLAEKKLEERKRKRGLGKEFENKDNFSGLIKMSLFQEKWSGQNCKN